MHRPFPPANFKINGSYWISYSATTSLVLTWASRNRLSQTNSLLNYYVGSITSEAGITYSGNVKRTDTMAVLDSFAGISALTYTLTAGYTGQVLVSIWSINANGVSLQTVTNTMTIASDVLTTEGLDPITTEFLTTIEI